MRCAVRCHVALPHRVTAKEAPTATGSLMQKSIFSYILLWFTSEESKKIFFIIFDFSCVLFASCLTLSSFKSSSLVLMDHHYIEVYVRERLSKLFNPFSGAFDMELKKKIKIKHHQVVQNGSNIEHSTFTGEI